MKDFSDLRLFVFRPPVAISDRQKHDAAYRFWKSIWIDANTEMVRPTNFPSDPFTRQTEILCLFRGDKPVALICHKNVDFEAESTFDDSAFFPGTWRDEDKSFVRKLGGIGIMGSQITLAPEERGRDGEVSMKDLIVLLSLTYAQNIGAETVVASIRTAKGLDKLFGSAGSLVIAPARPFFGASVDLIAFRPQVAPISVHPVYRKPIEALLRTMQISEPLDFKKAQTQRKAA